MPRTVARSWNAFVDSIRRPDCDRSRAAQPGRADPNSLAAAPRLFREDVEHYLTWASVPDPLADGARARALAPLSLAPAAHAHPFGRDRSGCGRDPAGSAHLVSDPCRTRNLPRATAPSLAGGRRQAVGLHPWRRRHLDRDRFGMGKGVRRMQLQPSRLCGASWGHCRPA